jgi:hypothetical protein
MRCDICGAEIQWHQETLEIKSKGESIGRGGSLSRVGTETVRITLCPACAQERNAIRRVWFLVALGLVLTVVALAVGQLLPLLR